MNKVRELDVTEPVALAMTLETAPVNSVARVENAEGEVIHVVRVPGGWIQEGDVIVTSSDIAWGEPREVWLWDDGPQAPSWPVWGNR